VKARKARVGATIAATAALAVAGCGDAARTRERPPATPPPASAAAAAAEPGLASLTTAQAARAADRIALVVSRGSRVVEGAPGTPFTRTRFAVQEVLKGTLPRHFVVQVIGGRMGSVTVSSLVPAFVRSQRYILFLGPDNRTGPTIFPQAIFAVKRTSGADIVQPAPSGLRIDGAQLHDVIGSIRTFLRTTGSTR
jgi:hypothetical protein